jgi:hypothetical protein
MDLKLRDAFFSVSDALPPLWTGRRRSYRRIRVDRRALLGCRRASAAR